MDSRKIGVFDSGLGGLTVVREMKRLLPKESLVYFGDTARLPYGSKSKEAIVRFSKQIMRFLMRHDVKAVIIACGTASANALEELRATFDLPIFGVVEPGVREAARSTRSGRIGITGTEATIRSGAYERLLKQINPALQVFSQACPLFVPLVEEGWFEDPVTRSVVHSYLQELKKQTVDTLVLGCTHYPLLRKLVQEEIGEEVTLVNPSSSAVQEVKAFLECHAMQTEDREGQYTFFASDNTEKFQAFGQQVLEMPLTVQKIQIETF